MSTPRGPIAEQGQVLPIAALFMGVLLLFAALAIDVTGVLSAQRFFTTTSDAAALAGAQDLQEGKTRKVTPTDRQRAREHAMQVLADELDASSSPGCSTNADIIDCALPGTPYLVSIRTPAPHCEQCDVNRAVKVTIRRPDHPLTFARLAGHGDWNVESSAVGAIDYAGKYALIALKPQDNYDPGIVLNGAGTQVQVDNGDIGTNTHLIEEPGQVVFTDTAQWIYHYNPTTKSGKLGFEPATMSRVKTSYIADPVYTGPSWPAVKYDGQSDPNAFEDPCPSAVANLPRIQQLVIGGVIASADEVTCYKPGVYAPNKGNGKFTVPKVKAGPNDDDVKVAYFLPGAYLFEGGLDVGNGGYVYGGLVSSERGVLLSMPPSEQMDLEAATEIVLNTAVSGPAVDWTGREIISDPPENMMITFYVPRDPNCFSGGDPTLPINSNSCSANPVNDADIKLAGTGELNIAGVIYAPTENIAIVGNSNTDAIDGQIVGWTLEWSGGSKLRINYPDFEQLGILRLDAACTGDLTGSGQC
jgi:hypothetical protein